MRILTHEQATQVAAAMAALNKLPAVAHIRIVQLGTIIHVQEFIADEVDVWVSNAADVIIGRQERYRDQAEFCACYGVEVPL